MVAATTKRPAVERQSGVALWRQIADAIRGRLGNGAYGPLGRLPSEAQLSSEFAVNRHTVRAALKALQQEGVVETRQGLGTFAVSRTRLSYPIGPHTRFSAGLEGQVTRATMRLLASSVEPAPADAAKALDMATGAPSLRVEAVGEADGIPVSRSSHWFGAMRFAALPEHLRETGSMTRALAACGVGDYSRRATEVNAALASPADRADLMLAPGAVVLIAEAVNVDSAGVAIQFSRTRFPAERVSLSISSR